MPRNGVHSAALHDLKARQFQGARRRLRLPPQTHPMHPWPPAPRAAKAARARLAKCRGSRRLARRSSRLLRASGRGGWLCVQPQALGASSMGPANVAGVPPPTCCIWHARGLQRNTRKRQQRQACGSGGALCWWVEEGGLRLAQLAKAARGCRARRGLPSPGAELMQHDGTCRPRAQAGAHGVRAARAWPRRVDERGAQPRRRRRKERGLQPPPREGHGSTRGGGRARRLHAAAPARGGAPPLRCWLRCSRGRPPDLPRACLRAGRRRAVLSIEHCAARRHRSARPGEARRRQQRVRRARRDGGGSTARAHFCGPPRWRNAAITAGAGRGGAARARQARGVAAGARGTPREAAAEINTAFQRAP